MKTVINGGPGLGAASLLRPQSAAGAEVHATCLPFENIKESCTSHNLDILDKEAVCEVLEQVQPDVIYHLAAQSSVSLSWKKPQMTAEINVVGTINVLEAVRSSSKQNMRIILIGSGMLSGHTGFSELRASAAGHIISAVERLLK